MGGSTWRERTLRDRLEAYATLPGAVSRDRARREVASASCLSSSLHGRIHLARTRAQTGWKPMLRCRLNVTDSVLAFLCETETLGGKVETGFSH
jgi:hypothetical protein